MPFVNLNQFVAKDLLKAADLNTIISALQGFSAQPADITWPLIAGGNIDFDQTYGIIGLRTFWNIVNADEYANLQAAVDAAEGYTNATIVFIPPNTTIPADGVNVEASNIWIVGAGPSSIIQSTGSSGYSIRTGNAGLSNLGLANLTMDGASVAGQDGIQFRYINGITVKNVHFQDWDGAALVITNAGTAGTQRSQNAFVDSCWFEGGASAHIDCSDLDVGLFTNIVSDSATATAALDFEPSTAAAYIKRLKFQNIQLSNVTGIGVQILGASATANDLWSLITLDNVDVTASTGDGFNLGEASKILKNLSVRNCDAPASGADAFVVNANIGRIQNCNGYNATGDGLDLVSSNTIKVTGCDLSSAGAYGIDADGTAVCHIHSNDVDGAATAGILKTNSTTLACGSNYGDVGPAVGMSVYDDTEYTKSTTGALAFTYTVPGGTVRIGDSLRVRVPITYTHTSGSATWEMKIGGVIVAQVAGVSTSYDPAYWEILVSVAALSGAGSTRTSGRLMIDGGGVGVDYESDTIDWTGDNAITFNISALGVGSLTLRNITIEHVGVA